MTIPGIDSKHYKVGYRDINTSLAITIMSIFTHPSATIPTLYGQAKIHKDGIPMRPILSMVGAYNHGLATYLGKTIFGTQR